MKDGQGIARRLGLFGLALVFCAGLDGCLMIGGSSRGGFFIWPGGLGLVLVIFFVVMLLRRR